MQSTLIVSKDQQKRQEYIAQMCGTQKISKFDRSVTAPTATSFGIEDVRNLQKTAYLSPNQGKEKAIILEEAQLLTTEAQNALLKLLEEPPQNTYIFLSASSSNNFLPTILSRCKIVELEQSREEVSEEKKDQLHNQLQVIEQGTIGERLALAETIAADKENLARWFEQIILFLRDELLKNPKNKQLVRLILAIQNAHKDFQTTNVSPRVILEHCFLNL